MHSQINASMNRQAQIPPQIFNHFGDWVLKHTIIAITCPARIISPNNTAIIIWLRNKNLVALFIGCYFPIGMDLNICAITSTVHQFPKVLYLWLSLNPAVYPSGKVCNLSYSVGVSFLIIWFINTHSSPLAVNVADFWWITLPLLVFELGYAKLIPSHSWATMYHCLVACFIKSIPPLDIY